MIHYTRSLKQPRATTRATPRYSLSSYSKTFPTITITEPLSDDGSIVSDSSPTIEIIPDDLSATYNFSSPDTVIHAPLTPSTIVTPLLQAKKLTEPSSAMPSLIVTASPIHIELDETPPPSPKISQVETDIEQEEEVEDVPPPPLNFTHFVPVLNVHLQRGYAGIQELRPLFKNVK
ncbi:hypothetical protein P9112_004914 [Eukaryota sp. TZLM1-RC]